MLRTVTAMVLISSVFAVNAMAADVVSAKLCMEKDYDATTKDCAGKSLEGGSGSIAVPAGSVVTLLSTIKTTTNEEVYHVWIANGKTGGKVTVYDAATKTMKDAEQMELDWLKERKIEGAVGIVKLPVSASAGFRTRSSKTIGLKATGMWTVKVFGSGMEPLQELTFMVN